MGTALFNNMFAGSGAGFTPAPAPVASYATTTDTGAKQPTQEYLQTLSKSGGAQAVFDYAKTNNLSLDQLAKIGGVSTAEMANLAQSQGITTSQLGQIGYTAPAPVTPTQNYNYTYSGGMFGDPTFGISNAQREAMGLSSDPRTAQMQIASGNYKLADPNAVYNNATVGNTSLGMRISDQQVKDILSGMESGKIDPKLGALQLSQGQVNLYDLTRISGKDPAAIQAAAANNGIRFADALGQHGVIQQGGLLNGMSLENAASASGGRAMTNPNGTITFQERSQLGTPYHSDSYIFDLTRMGAGLGRNQTEAQQRQNYAGVAADSIRGWGGQVPSYTGYTGGAANQPSPQYRAPSYTAPTGYGQTKPLTYGIAPIGYGGYGGMQGYGGYGRSMYPYQNYGRQGMFGGTATSRMPYTGYQAYQPYGGYGRNTGMFGAPTMNYNMRNRPMQQITPYQQMGWSQNNPWSFQ